MDWKIIVPNHPEPPEGKQPPIIIQAIYWLNNSFDFRRNINTEHTEFRYKDTKEWKPVTDQIVKSISIQMHAVGLSINVQRLSELLTSKFVKEFDQIRDYFRQLSDWDGTDYIGLLAETVQTTDDEAWHIYLKKWLVTLVRTAFYRNCVNQHMLVLYGGQGVGKTTWILKLLPKPLYNLKFTGYTKLDDQMFQSKLGRFLLIFFDELDTYTGRMQAIIKSTITQEIIKIRPLYSKFEQEYTRIASFIAAINHESFLTDLSGSRRYLVVEVNSINHQHAIDMDKVFSQAFSLAKDDSFLHYFNKEETKLIEDRNDQFRAKSDEELLLLHYFEPCIEPCPGSRYLTTSQVKAHLNEISQNKSTASLKALGLALKHLGFKRVSTGTGNSKRVTWLIVDRDV